MKKSLKIIVIVLAALTVISVCGVFIINMHVKRSGKRRIVSAEEAAGLEDVDCIIVLGCLVNGDNRLSGLLADRLRRGVELYDAGAAPKLLMSGDHGRKDYDEVNAMKDYAKDCGVPSEDVFMDHAGFSTYETMYRAKAIFGAKKVIIVTQEYHLYRAVYIAGRLGLDAYGVASDYHTYGGQTQRDLREVLARCKDFFMTIFKPEPTYLGEKIPIDGNGDATNDKEAKRVK